MNPRYREALDNLAWLYIQQEQYEQGLLYLNRSIDVKSDNGWAYYQRSRIHYQQGRIVETMRDAQKACQLGITEGCSLYERCQIE